jgi:transposase
MEKEKEEGGHCCPYCGHKSYLINDHFNHIEFFHPGKPLIIW